MYRRCCSKLFRIHFLLLCFLTLWFIWTSIRQYEHVTSKYFSHRPWSPLRSQKLGPWQNRGRYCYRNDSSVILFLHITNNSSYWTPIEVCAFTLAAVHNPDTGVCVLSAYPVEPDPSLSSIPNLEISPMNFSTLFKDSPLSDWYENYISNSRKRRGNWLWELSDALRYIYLYKYGGKYMDTDSWTLRNLAQLQNVAGWQEQDGVIGSGVLFFERQHPFMEAVLANFTKYFRAGIWGSTGPDLVTIIHESELVPNTSYQIVPRNYFYPLHFMYSDYPFMPDKTDTVKGLINNTFAVHLWRSMVRDFFEAPPENGSYVAEVLTTVCSLV